MDASVWGKLLRCATAYGVERREGILYPGHVGLSLSSPGPTILARYADTHASPLHTKRRQKAGRHRVQPPRRSFNPRKTFIARNQRG